LLKNRDNGQSPSLILPVLLDQYCYINIEATPVLLLNSLEQDGTGTRTASGLFTFFTEPNMQAGFGSKLVASVPISANFCLLESAGSR
jgi:hypothetical protein